MPKTYPRKLRIESLIRNHISELFVGNTDFGLITIEQVEISSDYQQVFIYYNLFPDSQKENEVALFFQSNEWRFRKFLANHLNMRSTPKLKFLMRVTSKHN